MRWQMRDRPRSQLSLALGAAAAGVAAASAPGTHEYASGAWSTSFFRPNEVKLDAVGFQNEDSVFVATRSSIKALHNGFLTPVIEVPDEEVKAFHLCHHRNSLFFEALSRDGGALSIYEFSLSAKQKSLVGSFQDAVPASSLACAEQWVLRVSPAGLGAVHVPTGKISTLGEIQDHEKSDAISSVSVEYAADTISNAVAYTVGNRTIWRHRFKDEGDGKLAAEAAEIVLPAGGGSDGPIAIATVQDPQHVLATRQKVLFTDGCSVRELADGHVRTLLGSWSCVSAGNETLEPAPWASRLSRPRALAAPTPDTQSDVLMLLTETQVVRIGQESNKCAGKDSQAAAGQCTATAGCAWAEGPAEDERLCFQCDALSRWAASSVTPVNPCNLSTAGKQENRYTLTPCGCSSTLAEQAALEQMSGSSDIKQIAAAVAVMMGFFGFVLYRRHATREKSMNELYGLGDGADFYTFTDHDDTA